MSKIRMMTLFRYASVPTIALALAAASPARAQTAAPSADGSEWDRARAQLIAGGRTGMAEAIERWKQLIASDRFGFADYSGFVLAYPGFPLETQLRGYAEKALARESASPSAVALFFDRYAPLTNYARGRYAVALATLRRRDARAAAVAAWRGGALDPASEAQLYALYGAGFTEADQDARMDALLWQGEADQAARQIATVSAGARDGFMARLALTQGADPEALGLAVADTLPRDPGYVYNRVALARKRGDAAGAARLLAARPPLAALPLDQEKWVAQQLAAARGGDAASAARIAGAIDDAFAPGTDVSRLSYRLRDDYTSLMWLGGTRALWELGDPARAAALFQRYGAAAQTPQTRAKGFYWAGRARAQAGDAAAARRAFALAAQNPESFYGMLALERLGRPLPPLDYTPAHQPTEADRRAFAARPLTQAVREVAREADWPVTVRFFREISDQARSESDHVLVADLARDIGRRDLGVILGQAAHADDYPDFARISFPLIPVPDGADWTMVHALARQESQFAQNAVSYAGARGLLQLMPRTAQEQAAKVGLAYSTASLTADAGYNLRLGDAYFARLMDYFGGSYPLAVGAYNAGAGNVNKWLRANGDPRTGAVAWVDWIERIPIGETRTYIQRVLENAVVYEAMNPARARYHGGAPLSFFLAKSTPG